ncbi:hypothetical protein ML064_002351 [Klebsiella quasipneumoniae]|nr:hypothetical protein [Klebsiella quasipneumoniae]
MTDITELALMKGQKVEAPYYLAECTECGKMYSSSKFIASRNYFDGDADCYCPHCNAEDADIADLGSGEQPAAMAWNYQQARIDVLVEALEKAQAKADVYDMLRDDYGLREKGVGLADFVDWQANRIAELESRTVTVKLPAERFCPAEYAGSQLWSETEVWNKAITACADELRASGIKVEAE